MKALFFLRHYNDIDHITPVISKWIDSGHTCDIVLIGNSRFKNDYRINFLKGLKGARMAYIADVLPPCRVCEVVFSNTHTDPQFAPAFHRTDHEGVGRIL